MSRGFAEPIIRRRGVSRRHHVVGVTVVAQDGGRWRGHAQASATGITPRHAVPFEGKIYLVGAMTGRYPTEPPLANVFIYDPAADKWAEGPEIPAGRRRGGAGAVLHNGEIIVIAGITNGHSDGHVTWVRQD